MAWAYPTHVAAAMSGASLRKLQYSRQRRDGGPLLTPEGRAGGRVLYSFRDVMALRTFVYLREQLPLQRVRKAVSNLGELGDGARLSTYCLYVSGSSIEWAESDDKRCRASTNWRLRCETSSSRFTNIQGEEVVDLLRPRPRLAVDPGVRGGLPSRVRHPHSPRRQRRLVPGRGLPLDPRGGVKSRPAGSSARPANTSRHRPRLRTSSPGEMTMASPSRRMSDWRRS